MNQALSKKTLVALSVALLSSACTAHSTARQNYFIAETSIALLYAYVGEAFTPDPEFRVYQLKSPLTPYPDFSDSVTLKAYSDSACTIVAPGTFKTTTNPAPFTHGIATFSNVSYTLPGAQEGLIYFKGTIESDQFSTCGVSHSIIQHFNHGVGSVHFGSPGTSGTATASTISDHATAVRITSDGHYIATGNTKNISTGETSLALWRYLPNGALDPSFNSIGYLTAGSPGAAGGSGGTELDTPMDLQIDSSGNYVIVGTSQNASGGLELAVWRYLSTGILDSSFGSGGIFHPGVSLTGRTPSSQIRDYPKALAIDSSGNLWITGTSLNASGGYQLFVVKLTSAGALNPNFGTAGIYTYGATGLAGATGNSLYDVGYAIQIAANGNPILVGSSANTTGGQEMAIWKVQKDGLTLDSTFGSNGTRTFGSPGVAGGTGTQLQDVGRSLQIDDSGYLVIAGSSMNSSGGTEMALWRYQDNGILDSKFGYSGSLHFNLSSGGNAGAAGATGAQEKDIGLSVLIDTRYSFYIVGGTSVNASGGTQAAIWRFTLPGVLDLNFALSGYTVTPSTGTAGGQTAATVLDSLSALVLDPYGTYIGVGSTLNSNGGTEMAIWRYLITGLPDF